MDLEKFDPERALATRKMYLYKPYGHPDMACPDGSIWRFKHENDDWLEWSNKPWQLDFHNAGSQFMERGLFTANGVGKTTICATEVAYHLTGWYPDWWKGKRFDKPILAWACARSNDAQREYTQPALVGENLAEAYGTGAIPLHLMLGRPRTRQAGLPDVVDTVLVKRADGKGVSTLRFKVYEQGWKAFAGGKPDVIWDDEEFDDFRVYTEEITRLARTNGIIMVSLTPMSGETKLTMHFMREGKRVYWQGAGWDDVAHISDKMKSDLRDSYPDSELQARSTGIPMMGTGRIFTVPDDDVFIDPFDHPRHWARIKGVDFGTAHPAALVDSAYDRDNDRLFVIADWRRIVNDYTEHCAAINAKDPWVPVAWPHDGENRRAGTQQLKRLYVAKGCAMLGKSACYKSDKLGPQPVEPIIKEAQERLASGRQYFFKTCVDLRDEYNSYHRDEKGNPVAIHDDCLKAWFYALMMRRYAATRIIGAGIQQAPARPILRVV